MICRNNLSDPEDEPFFILCTKIDLTNQQIIVRYLKRWGIEAGYRNGKHLLGQDEYQGRSVLGTSRHWCLGRAAYTYLELRRRYLILNLQELSFNVIYLTLISGNT